MKPDERGEDRECVLAARAAPPVDPVKEAYMAGYDAAWADCVCEFGRIAESGWLDFHAEKARRAGEVK